MQKHASSILERAHRTFFSPLPVAPDAAVYYDRAAITLSYAEHFPKLHYHDRYEIGICEEGEGLFVSDGVFSTVSEGDFVFIAPNKHHYAHALREDTPCRLRFVYLLPDALRALLRELGVSRDEEDEILLRRAGEIPTVLPRERLADAAEPLHGIASILAVGERLSKRQEGAILLRTASFLLEADRWLTPLSDRAQSSPRAVGDAARMAEYLSLHYQENSSAKELAALCHLSESQLRRSFVAAYGIPPIAYRNALRCRIGAALLSRTNLSVAQIAERVGYTSPSDFYRTFRKLRGVSPSEYRKKTR